MLIRGATETGELMVVNFPFAVNPVYREIEILQAPKIITKEKNFLVLPDVLDVQRFNEFVSQETLAGNMWSKKVDVREFGFMEESIV